MFGRCNNCGAWAIRCAVYCRRAGAMLKLCASCYYVHSDTHVADY